MAFHYCNPKVLEQFYVSPPPNSVPETHLPLTFFDIPWLFCMPIKRILLFKFPFSTSHFMQNILPRLKCSLSSALQHFFPYVGTLVCPTQRTKPYFLYRNGDSVNLTIAEANGDFDHLLTDSPKDVKVLHPLVPDFPQSCHSVVENAEVFALLALQVTVFPNSGICIGITYRHAIADGRCLQSLIKTWASIFKSNGDVSSLANHLPIHYNRDVVRDVNGLEDIFLDQWWMSRLHFNPDKAFNNYDYNDKVRATFVMSQHDIKRLKHWISEQINEKYGLKPLYISAFVAVCAFVWVCLVKSQSSPLDHTGISSSNDVELPRHFCFVADCRNRYEFSLVPETYFGNFLAICFVSAKKGELVGENGLLIAAKAIGSRVMELSSGALQGAEDWISKWHDLSSEHLVTVAGSPNLCVYESDFGWGMPKKSEVVQIDASGAIALAESRDEEGGVEIGLALSTSEMSKFCTLFKLDMLKRI